MATIILMPQRGLTEESALIAKWYVKVGDKVKHGDYLFDVEIGKATFPVESEAEGTVLEIWAEEGDDVPIKDPVCVIGQPGDTYEKPKKEAEASEAAAPAEAPAQAPAAAAPAAVAAEPKTGRIFISPRAKDLAIRRGIDYRYAVATGPEDRIIERDIDAMLETGPFVSDAARAIGGDVRVGTGIGGAVTTADLEAPAAPAAPKAAAVQGANFTEYTARPNSPTRKAIAKNMHKSLSEMAQLTMSIEFDATELLAYRAKIKERGADCGLGNISLNDMVVFAVSRVLGSFPDLNAHYSDDEMKLFKHVNMGVAVDTEKGLLVPTVFGAEGKTLNEISAELKTLAEAGRAGTLKPAQMKDATFTISNIGSFGVTSFTPVINPPQVAILGVTGIRWAFKMGKDGQPQYYQAMGLSLTIDHRAIDGAPAAKFLKALCKELESFSLLLAK